MERHGIPTMVISENPLWKMAELILQSRHPLTGKTTVLRRYPIDLGTFESITPGQLNRNLASLVSIYSKKSAKTTVDSTDNIQTKPFLYVKKYATRLSPFPYLNDDHGLTPVLRLLTLIVLLSVAILLSHSALRAGAILFSQLLAQSAISNIVSLPVSFQQLA
jgi:hypothetical protein